MPGIFNFFFAAVSCALGQAATGIETDLPKDIVRKFLAEVRSGRFPEHSRIYMADTVIAHQVYSEGPLTVVRTPEDYASHVREFIRLFGRYDFEVTELLADGQKVYARWIQKGNHLQEIDGYAATGKPLVEFTSAVYRIEKGKIVEYWLQTDRLGFEMQLREGR